LAKQDEKQRQRRRLQERAIEMAATNIWAEAVEINKQILAMGEDTDTYNRLGKAYLELGQYTQSHDCYQQALRLTPTNSIARKNLARLDILLARGVEQGQILRSARQQVDLRLFITETGRTALTTLVDAQRNPAVDALVTGEKMDFKIEGKTVYVIDADGNVIGRLEPKLSQRLAELIGGGNRYIAAIAQADMRQVRLLIRETYQDPSQRGRISFPGKLGEGAMYVSSVRYEDYDQDILDEEENVEESETMEEEYLGGDEEEELGLDEIEQDMGDDDDGMEE
jgi:tetratricopeptide (TPR) repeat protein